MVFDPTSTQEATHDCIHPELTNSSISVELKFDTALTNKVEVFFLGENHLRCILTLQETYPKYFAYERILMDEDQIYFQVKKCKHLKYKFRGVYAADNYPLNLPVNSFIIVNA